MGVKCITLLNCFKPNDQKKTLKEDEEFSTQKNQANGLLLNSMGQFDMKMITRDVFDQRMIKVLSMYDAIDVKADPIKESSIAKNKA